MKEGNICWKLNSVQCVCMTVTRILYKSAASTGYEIAAIEESVSALTRQ